MWQIIITIGLAVAVGTGVGVIARLVTFDNFGLSLPKTSALAGVGALAAQVAQWLVLTPAALHPDASTAVLGGVAVMCLYRACAPAAPSSRPSEVARPALSSPAPTSGRRTVVERVEHLARLPPPIAGKPGRR